MTTAMPVISSSAVTDPLLERLALCDIDGPEFCRLNTGRMDETLNGLWQDIFGDQPGICLLALGGYGRRELCPHSDIDLMFYAPEGVSPSAQAAIEKFLYALWDRKLKVGHAVRTRRECLELAVQNSKVMTALIDCRVLCGDTAAGEMLRENIAHLLPQEDKLNFMRSKLKEREARHARYGDTRYVLEPNIKEGKGGLRDFQTLLWITGVIYGATRLHDLAACGILTPAEARKFEKSHGFLLNVRCHLHQIAGRAEERLHFDIQPDLAERLGYASRNTGKAVERFMKHYFLVTRDIGDLTRILCAAIEEQETPEPGRGQSFLGFEAIGNRLRFGTAQNLKTRPLDMLRLFRVSQDTGRDIHPFAVKEITRSLRYVDDVMRNDAVANQIFMEILNSPKGAAHTLRRMNETGLLSRFIPDFGRIVGLMQFDRYHYFTVDEHTIRCVDLLHELEQQKFVQDAPLPSAVAFALPQREALYAAMFLHDICKGRGGGHAELGGELALTLGPRFGLSGEQTDLVSWLVHEHLLMSDTAFRRNMNDPKTIADFSARIRSRDRLDMLLCLTTVDIMGVGPGRWTAWKARLLEELYTKTRALMAGEEPGMVEQVAMPADYQSGATRIDIRHEEAQSATVIIVYTPDRAGLFATLCGALSAEGASIMRAYINTVEEKSGPRLAIDRFVIQNASGLPFVQARRQDDLRQSILDALAGSLDLPGRIGAHRKVLSKKDLVFDIPPRIQINNTASGTDTVVEIEMRDRHGLLHDIACVFRDQGLDIRAAKINTQGLRAIDSFYVQTAKKKKLVDAKAQERLVGALNSTVANR